MTPVVVMTVLGTDPSLPSIMYALFARARREAGSAS
ncbi:MAG: hypothetical protein BJ554DRAFT_8370 [Olpidium bornovanus]|uniref:Uncharacterized protein n=1 Tax=Olpidium bornovanus TaxID=278681 RepID=A0A8H7ZVA0_9FUNG|nr:MAG: hypothetical protein BJ554DRAFT_8370 [Olpidium bornovanus]